MVTKILVVVDQPVNKTAYFTHIVSYVTHIVSYLTHIVSETLLTTQIPHTFAIVHTSTMATTYIASVFL